MIDASEQRSLQNPARLDAIRRTALFDAPPDAAFQRLTQLARHVLHVPIIVISLIDDVEQYFLSSAGLPEAVTASGRLPTSFSLCTEVVVRNEAVRLDDTAASEAFCDNPSVQALGMGAFFGMPIRSASGLALGAFSIVDSEQRYWTDAEAEVLENLSAMASSEIELRLTADEARRQAASVGVAELRQSERERQHVDVLDNLSEVVFQTDATGRWTYLNAVWEEMTGFTVRESLGQSALDHIAPEDRADCGHLFVATHASDEDDASTGERFRQELRFFRNDGTYRWIELRGRHTYISENGRDVVTGVSGTISDITDRYESLQRLAENEVRFRTIVECLGEGLIITDLDDCVQYVNARMAEMAGYTPREMFGKAAYELLLPEAEWASMRNRTRQRAEGFSEQYQTCLLTKSRRQLWVEVHATPFFDADGNIIGTLSANTDITARKEAEDRLQEITEELRRSNQSLQEFATVASHDLQEPLRKIQAFGDRLQQKCEVSLGTEGMDYLSRMQGAAGRMQSLINDLLLYSRVASKAQPFKPVDLNAVIRDVLGDLEIRIHQTGGRVDVAPLPSLNGDPVQLAQLFQNLIGNALKFHVEGRPPVVTVRAELLEPGDGKLSGQNRSSHSLYSGPICRISVRDNGIGFEPRHAERIFDVFERLHSRTEFEGTGMGLAICRRIVERHGGVIHAISSGNSGSDGGANFVIDLPYLRVGSEK